MAGPTVRRIKLGRELQRIREALGVTRPAAAAAIGCSPSRIGHIESGRNVLNKAELIVLARDLYSMGEAELASLEDLRSEASARGWWSTCRLPDWLTTYIGLEADAVSMRCIESEVIPGLLQTESYMRRLFELDGRLTQGEIDKRVAARLQRQQRLAEPSTMRLRALVPEVALRRCAQEPAVRDDQLAQLLDRAGWPNIELRVLPVDATMHAGMGCGTFTLLSFPENVLDDVACLEHIVGGHLIDEQSVVAYLATMFSELRGKSLGCNESLAMIAQLAEQARMNRS